MSKIELTREKAEKMLRYMMETISERCWCAGWLDTLVYDLPEIAVLASMRNQDIPYGTGFVYVFEAKAMLTLAIGLGYWIDYDTTRPIDPNLKTFFEELEKARNE